MSKLELFAHCKATLYLNLIFYLLKIHYLIAMDSSQQINCFLPAEKYATRLGGNSQIQNVGR